MPINTDPLAPWNDPIYANDPLAPHNDPLRKDDPFEPWNEPFGNEDDLSNEDRRDYGLREKK